MRFGASDLFMVQSAFYKDLLLTICSFLFTSPYLELRKLFTLPEFLVENQITSPSTVHEVGGFAVMP
jgi:hypothetical protein